MKILDPFYDPSDLSACVTADSSIAELNQKAAKDGIYFPLWRDEAQSFGDLYMWTRVCSRSFRFGWVGDNVLGSRFKLTKGKTLELGGRVVKNVVGLDLLRFFAGSQGRFGAPETLVVRLRPLPEIRVELSLSGPLEHLNVFRADLLLSPWVHAIDAFDFEFVGGSCRLAIAYACTSAEATIYDKALRALAATHGCDVSESPLPKHDGGHELRVPISQTLDVAAKQAGPVTGFLGHGTIVLPGQGAQASRHPDLEAKMSSLLAGLA